MSCSNVEELKIALNLWIFTFFSKRSISLGSLSGMRHPRSSESGLAPKNLAILVTSKLVSVAKLS